MTVRDLTFPGSVTPAVGFRDPPPARSLPLFPLVLAMRRSSRSGATRVARCAGGCVQIGVASSSFRHAGGTTYAQRESAAADHGNLGRPCPEQLVRRADAQLR